MSARKPSRIALDDLVLLEAYPPPAWADLWSVAPPPPAEKRRAHIYDECGWPSPPFALADLLTMAAYLRSFEGRPATETEQRLLYVCRGLLATAAKMAIYAEHFRKKCGVGVTRPSPLAKPFAARAERDNPRRDGARFKRRQP